MPNISFHSLWEVCVAEWSGIKIPYCGKHYLINESIAHSKTRRELLITLC